MLQQFNCYNSANNFVSLQNFSKRIPSKCTYCFNGEASMKKRPNNAKETFFSTNDLCQSGSFSCSASVKLFPVEALSVSCRSSFGSCTKKLDRFTPD